MGRTAGAPSSSLRARDIGQRDDPAVVPDAILAEAARAMVSARRKVLPVVDADGRLLGGLDRPDLLRASTSTLELAGDYPTEED
jgi:CBS domain-containing protein